MLMQKRAFQVILILLLLGFSEIRSRQTETHQDLLPHKKKLSVQNKYGFLQDNLFSVTQSHPPKSNHPKTQASHPKKNESNGLGGWIIALIASITLLVIALALIVYRKCVEHQVKSEGAMKTELGIRRQDLNSKQLKSLNMLSFNSKSDSYTKKFYCSDVNVKSTTEKANQVSLGEYMSIDFTQSGIMRMIVCNRPVSQKLENSYFEIEIDQLKLTPTNPIIGIGFISSSQIAAFQASNNMEYSKMFQNRDSILFASNGLLKHGSQQIDLNISALSYGETLGNQLFYRFYTAFYSHLIQGIGFSKSSQRIWLTYNGEFLNPLSKEELQSKFDEKTLAKIRANSEIDLHKTNDEIKAEEQQQVILKQRVVKLEIQVGKKNQIDEIYPFIMSNCSCIIDVNVGGYPFRFNQREIATGLLE